MRFPKVNELPSSYSSNSSFRTLATASMTPGTFTLHVFDYPIVKVLNSLTSISVLLI
ncbi:hypothetical protein HanRHA438_Chr09g0396921 [Helianthus annuus]|nr:hypothetical protein HanRHA438_Chr09g0396921 [Helianthus annuus]